MVAGRFSSSTCVVLLLFVLSLSSANKVGRHLRFFGEGFNDCEISNPCMNGATCISAKKKIRCACSPGYTGRTCDTDIDECVDGTDLCEEDCTNTDGGYTCSCSTPGYELDGDFECVDANECDDETDQCEEDCTNTDGGYLCSCSTPGSELAENGYTCVAADPDACDVTNQCEEICTKTAEGGYTCSCSTPGYELAGDGYACVDANECDDGTDLCEEDCTNTDGGYTCSCSTPGYELDGDECVVDVCHSGALLAEQKISSTQGGLVGPLNNWDAFGSSVTAADFDGDGVTDLVVGAYGDGWYRGAVYVLLLNPDHTVKAEQKISSTHGGLMGPLDSYDYFGSSVAAADFDGDGVMDLVAGAPGKNGDGGEDRGAVYVLLLNPDHTVKAEQMISSTQGGLVGPLDDGDGFGSSVAAADFDGDGVMDLVVGAPGKYDVGRSQQGAVYVLLLNTDQTVVKAEQKISSTQGGLVGPLDDWDYFGSSVAAADFDGDGVTDLAVGAPWDGDGSNRSGAVYVLLLNLADQTVKAEQKISSTHGGLVGPLYYGNRFGASVAAADFDDDGVMDLVVGAPWNADDGGYRRGAVFVLLLNLPDQTVKAEQKISPTQGGLVGPLDDNDFFGRSVAAADFDGGDGVTDLVVGAHGDGRGGAVYALEVPRGYVPVCAPDETCVNTGDNTYICE